MCLSETHECLVQRAFQSRGLFISFEHKTHIFLADYGVSAFSGSHPRMFDLLSECSINLC